MKEHIERKRLKEAFNADLQTLQSLDEHTMNLILIEIDEAPAADVAPVRHGQWLPQIVLGEKAWCCSECKTLGSPHWKWCPMCGCRMDDEATSTCHDGVCEIPGVEEVDDYVE